MKIVQLILFGVGVLSFVAAAFFIGQSEGDTLWRAGVAAMLVDLVFMQLWSPAKAG